MTKKTLFVLAGALAFLLTSCENFMNGSNVREELERTIEQANAKSVTIVVSQDTTMGAFLSSGDKQCKINIPITVQYNLKKDLYIFKSLKAVSSSNTDISRNDCVQFEIQDRDDQRGIYKVSIKLIKEADDILIVPHCTAIPNAIKDECKPEYKDSGVAQDTTIAIALTTSVTISDYFTPSITDSNGQNLSEYFGKPYLSSDGQTLFIPTNKEIKLIYADSKEDTKDIIVKIDFTNIHDKDGNTGNNTFQHKYRVNKTRDTKKPVFTNASLYSTSDTRSQYYKTLSDKAFSDWGDSSVDNTEFLAHHVSGSVYADITGYDEDTGIGAVHVSETLLKYSDGTSPNSLRAIESSVTGKEDVDTHKYFIDYQMKSVMDGIVKLEFKLEDFAGNISDNSKVFYVLKDTLVESSSIHFAQEYLQFENNNEETWLSVIPIVEGDKQDVRLFFDTELKDNFYTNCIDDYTIQAYWGYGQNSITKPITITEGGDFTFTRDVSKFVYIKLIISDHIGNSAEIIRYMDPRPELNSFSWDEAIELGKGSDISIKGFDNTKNLANKSNSYNFYTKYIAYVYNSIDTYGNPVGEPTKGMYFVDDSLSNGQAEWINRIKQLNHGEYPINKLVRIHAVTFCGDFISPMSTDYIEYMIETAEEPNGEYGTPVFTFVTGKEPRTSTKDTSLGVNYEDIIHERGPYIKEIVNLAVTVIKNSENMKIEIKDYKTDLAANEKNVRYKFFLLQRDSETTNFFEDRELPDDSGCHSGELFSSDTPEFFVSSRNIYKLFIMASGSKGTYFLLDEEPEDWGDYGDEEGQNFYLNDDTTQTCNRIYILGDVFPPKVHGLENNHPFQNKTPGQIELSIGHDDSGMYKNKNGDYELTYYLIPSSSKRLQKEITYTIDELEKNFENFKQTILYEYDPNGPINSIIIPMGNEKGGVYNLVTIYEDIYHNATIVTQPFVNRLIGDVEVSRSGQKIKTIPAITNVEFPEQSRPEISINCETLTFTMSENDHIKVTAATEGGWGYTEEFSSEQLSEADDNKYIYYAFKINPNNGQDQYIPYENTWFKISGYKESESAFEMGFYNTQYIFIGDYNACNTKNAYNGTNGIQIFFDSPIFAHTIFFKDYIPDDMDEDNYTEWERRGAETGVFCAKPTEINIPIDDVQSIGQTLATTATYSYKDNYSSIPTNCYYRTIIHFADGDVIMTDIKQKK